MTNDITAAHEKTEPETWKDAVIDHLPSSDMLMKGVVTGVIVSAVTITGRKVIRAMAKSPVFMFGLGFMTGYWAHKHRRKIVARASSIAAETKALLQKQDGSTDP
jgi:hypothetical protein